MSRPANTVGGDFYDILPLDDGRLVVALGDVAGKGSPAALLMALLLAMLRTLVDERLEPADLMTRLNVQVCRHAPGIAVHHAVLRRVRAADRLADLRQRRPHAAAAAARATAPASGCPTAASRSACSSTRRTRPDTSILQPDDLLAVYSDGITEAENPKGQPFDEIGLETALKASRRGTLVRIGAGVVRAVERAHRREALRRRSTILLLRRRPNRRERRFPGTKCSAQRLTVRGRARQVRTRPAALRRC